MNRLKDLLVSFEIQLIFAEQIIDEIRIVSSREKFVKYFNETDVYDLIELLRIIGEFHVVSSEINICRDPKDNFLLSLAEASKADYLVTGDNDLLILEKYGNTNILPLDAFEKIISKY